MKEVTRKRLQRGGRARPADVTQICPQQIDAEFVEQAIQVSKERGEKRQMKDLFAE